MINMKQLIEHRLEVAEHNLEAVKSQPFPHWETIRSLEVRIQELKDILKELERVEIKPEPQPIEKLFELKSVSDVWVKHKEGYTDLGKLAVYAGVRTYLCIGDEMYEKGNDRDMLRLKDTYESFLIAEVPKF